MVIVVEGDELGGKIHLSQEIIKPQNICTNSPIILNECGIMKEYQVLSLSSVLYMCR